MESDGPDSLPRATGVLMLCPHHAMAAELTELLRSETHLSTTIDSRAYPDAHELEKLVASTPVGICFLDMETDPEQAFRVLAQRLDLPGRPPVVALLSENNPDLILRCLRHGASGFLLRPFAAEHLRLLLQRIAGLHLARSDAGSPAGRLVAVIPAKGACGATTVAVNLACQAKRVGTGRVLLADMDPLTSSLAFLLNLKSQHSFTDALTHAGHLDADLWKALVTSYQGVDVLLAPDCPADSTIETHDPEALLEYARRNYELVVLDCGGPFGKWNVRVAALSDEVLLVVTTEVSSLFSAQRALAYLEANGVERTGIRLVVNRFRKDAGLEPEDVQKALRIEVFHFLPRDDQAIDDAQIDGRPASADTRFAKSLATLASRLGGDDAGPPKPAPRRGLRSLFSR